MKLRETGINSAAYSDEYKELCFLAWYRAARPLGDLLQQAIPVDALGRRPSAKIIAEWRRYQNWDYRGDLLDSEVARQVEKKAIEEKVEMFTRHALLGKELQDKGMDFLRKHEIEKDATALKMIIAGVEMEKVSRGLPDALMAVAELQDDDLKSLVGKLLQHYDPNDTNLNIVEMENLTKDIVDGNFDEIKDENASQ